MKHIYTLLLLLLLISCHKPNEDRIVNLVKEWIDKEVLLPDKIVFSQWGTDTLSFHLPPSEYTIISYIDSVGCTSCKLQFRRWKRIMSEMDSVLDASASFFFIFHPKNETDLLELSSLMKRESFNHPVWIDNDDRFNKMNKLPVESQFHSLLVNRQNKIVAIGSPFDNPKIRKLFIDIVSNKTGMDSPFTGSQTEVKVEQSCVDLGEFSQEEEEQIVFKLKNIGQNPLVINDVVSSCGCMAVKFSKEPIQPESTTEVVVFYKSDQKGYFSKSLQLYCNTKNYPLVLNVKGNAI